MRILITEDYSIISDGLARLLRRSAYAVDCAYNGVEADNALVAGTYDLLILDIGLPKLTGHEVLKRFLDIKRQELAALAIRLQSPWTRQSA